MKINITEARKQLAQLVRAVEDGESVIITRYGKPIAELTRPTVPLSKVRFGGMKGRIQLYPGWDAPIDEDRFLEGDL